MTDNIRCELIRTKRGLVPIYMMGKRLNTQSYDETVFPDSVMEEVARSLLRDDGSYVLVKTTTPVLSRDVSDYYCLPEDAALVLECLFKRDGARTVPASSEDKRRRQEIKEFAIQNAKQHAVDEYINRVEKLFEATREADEPVRTTVKRRRADFKEVVDLIETANRYEDQHRVQEQRSSIAIEQRSRIDIEPDFDAEDIE